MKSAFFLAALAATSVWVGCENKSSTPTNTSNSNRDHTTPPDNTANNKRDQNANTPTPIDQSNDSKDIEISAQIRRAIMDDASMSTNAKNIKIITAKGGAVTLRGVVDSQAEKDAVEAKAKGVAGVQSVDNQLEVKTP
jgi:osmotically-inducible protein OsmY